MGKVPRSRDLARLWLLEYNDRHGTVAGLCAVMDPTGYQIVADVASDEKDLAER